MTVVRGMAEVLFAMLYDYEASIHAQIKVIDDAIALMLRQLQSSRSFLLLLASPQLLLNLLSCPSA